MPFLYLLIIGIEWFIERRKRLKLKRELRWKTI